MQIAPPAVPSTSMTSEPPALDVDRLLTTLDRHEVDFVLVGGVAAIAYGARRQRPTSTVWRVAAAATSNGSPPLCAP